MQLAWMTDLHLDFPDPADRLRFYEDLATCRADALLLGGDTGEAPTFAQYLEEIARQVEIPVYFVLGNHDYYHGSIAEVRAAAEALQHLNPRLVCLSATGVIELTPATGLVGHGGWGDGTLGDFATSTVRLNDYELIQDLAGYSPEILRHKLRRLGEDAAAHLRFSLPEALARYEHVVVLMHVPPFAEACWYQGHTGDDNWLPHFTCGLAGEVLRAMAQTHPHRHITVLCGHTHHPGEAQILPNLSVLTAGAEYGQPRIDRILDVE
jgi:predicted phosphohydrolase